LSGLGTKQPPTDWFSGRTHHFKQGSVDNLLDFGIPKWAAREPTELIEDLVRGGVDVVLCGHIHERAEFRMRLDDGQLQFFMDFYTENPPEYRETSDWLQFLGRSSVVKEEGDKRPIFLEVDPTVAAGQAVREARGHHKLLPPEVATVFRALRIPPYSDPLDRAEDKDAWWAKHRPLVLQTACLGPVDYPQRPRMDEETKTATRPRVMFQGIRTLSIEDDRIARIAYVGIEEIRTGPPLRERTDEWPAVVAHMMFSS
jgi:hypothetical protein